MRPPVTVAADFGNTRLLWEGELVRGRRSSMRAPRMLYGVARLRTDSRRRADAATGGHIRTGRDPGRKVDNIIRLPRSAMRDNNQVMVIDADDRLHCIFAAFPSCAWSTMTC